jgi:hypothetical protein
MLALAPCVGYIHEPFSPRTPAGISPAPFERYFTVVTSENEDRYLPGLERTLDFRYDVGAQLRAARGPRDVLRGARDCIRTVRPRLSGARPLVKDPIALLSAEWLADRFGMDVVVLIRHPGAFAASLQRLGWRHSFATFLDGDRVPAVLEPYEHEIREQAREPGDVLTQAALLWRVLYNAVSGYRERRPDWEFLRHEDVSLQPLETFERLYGRLGLRLTGRARSAIERASAPENPHELSRPHAVELDSAASLGRWREQLAPDEIQTLRERTSDVWPRFYSDEDW